MAKKGRNGKSNHAKASNFNYFKDISLRNAKVKKYAKEKKGG